MPDRYLLLGAAPASLVEEPLALTTWSDTEADGATIAVAAGAAIASIPNGVASCSAYSTRPWSAGDVFDLRAKLTITGTTTASVITYLIVTFGGGEWLFFRPRGDGQVLFKHNIGADITLATVTGRPVDGTGELRLTVRGSRVTARYRTGSAAWTLLYDDDVAGLVGLTGPSLLRIQAATEGGSLGADTTVTWSDLVIRSAVA